GGNRGLKLEQPPSTIGVVTERSRAFDSLGDVRDNPVTPAPNLVAEQPKATRRARPHGASGAAPPRCRPAPLEGVPRVPSGKGRSGRGARSAPRPTRRSVR